MKKFTSLLIGLSLALAGAAMAQQPEESPKKEKGAEKTQATEAKPGAKSAKPEATAKQTGAMKEHGAAGEPGATQMGAGKHQPKGKAQETATGATGETGVSAQTSGGATTEPAYGKRKGRAKAETATGATGPTGATGATGASVSPSPSAAVSASASPAGKSGRGEKGMKGAKASPSMTPATAASASASPATAASPSATAAASVSASASVSAAVTASPSVAATGQTTAGATTGAAPVKVDKQKVQQVKQQAQQIKQQHVNFRAQARPDRVPAVTFTPGYRIQGSESWQGPQYEVYRSYRPERRDRNWYASRYNRIELIGGGYYYWNNGYWYPAWGYDPSAEYYAYDAPIYVGHRAEPPDRVIADVQAELQMMGYYRGEVDGLLGPLTREALTAYQADQGLMATAVIDEPTLQSLGLG